MMNAVPGNVERTELLHKGKANNVYATTNPNVLELEASDRISAGNGAKTDVIGGKGEANNLVSMAIFQQLNEKGIPTHYIGPGSNAASKYVWKADQILLEVIFRFKTKGSFTKRYECEDMKPFDGVYIEYTYKSDNAGDPVIPESAIVQLGILTRRELGYIEYITEQVALFLKEFFAKCNGDLIDGKIEFGRLPNGQIAVTDEISPDTCRILDKETGNSLDKDRFRQDMGGVAEAYQEMAKRVAGLTEKKPSTESGGCAYAG
ncbi:MAG: phosphoribosylaminoimidazolesuccinocarboxamide synthase [Clostridia bacterium]|nr:phosphoribosylaminoimidazolesuccinocarboxamide synthase [Clostridia bacterium]